MTNANRHSQAYRYIFLGRSRVDGAGANTKRGNAQIHGMISVKPSSICYAAIQVTECTVCMVTLALTFGHRCMWP